MTAKHSKSCRTSGGASAWKIGFLLLTPAQQKDRICRLSAAGWSDTALCQLSGLGIHELRAILDPHEPTDDEPEPR